MRHHLRVVPRSNSPAERLSRAIALILELRQTIAPGFPGSSELLAGMHDRLAGEEVRLRSALAVVTPDGGNAA